MNQPLSGAIEALYFPDVAQTAANEQRMQEGPQNAKDLLQLRLIGKQPTLKLAVAVVDELLAQEA